MKLCLSMWSLHKKYFNDGWTVLDFLNFCAEHEIENVELLDVFWNDKATELVQVNQFLKEHQMTVGAYAVSNDFVNTDEAARQKAQDSIKNGIATALELGTNTIRVFAGDIKPGYDFNNAEAYIVDGFKQVAPAAEAAGVIMALENHGKLAGRGDQVRTIIEKVGSPNLRSTFDMGNFLLVGQSPLDAFAQLSPLVGHVHVKDFLPSKEGKGYQAISGDYYEGMACGQGEVPIEKLVDGLKTKGYSGYVSLEYEGFGDETDGVLDSFAYLRPLF